MRSTTKTNSTGLTNEEREQTSKIIEAIDRAIHRTSELLLSDKDVKVPVSDLLKLMQLRKELQEARPRHVTVRWVGTCSKPSQP